LASSSYNESDFKKTICPKRKSLHREELKTSSDTKCELEKLASEAEIGESSGQHPDFAHTMNI